MEQLELTDNYINSLAQGTPMTGLFLDKEYLISKIKYYAIELGGML